jgi:CxxC motif-containing protein (DUF1111 family)
VPAYTDLKLHTMCDGPTDPNAEALDQNQPAGSPGFFAGNQKLITRKLWGLYNSGSFMHHGKFTTMREAITLGHNGEATATRMAFQALTTFQQDDVIGSPRFGATQAPSRFSPSRSLSGIDSAKASNIVAFPEGV